MNERDWLILATLLKEQNISKTAKAMFISQSTLSVRIKHIEEYFNAQLLERTAKGIYFTPIGKAAAEFAEHYLLELEDFKNKIALLNQENVGELRIGMSPLLTHFIAAKVITDFSSLYPNVNFRIISKDNTELLDDLRNGSIQVAFTRTADTPFGMGQIRLATEPIYIVSAKPITLADLPNIPVIDYRLDPYWHAQFDYWWKNNFTAKIKQLIHVTDAEACKEIVRQGIGFGFFPALLIKDAPELCKIQVMDINNEPILRETRLLYKDVIPQEPGVARFIEFIKKHNYLQEDK